MFGQCGAYTSSISNSRTGGDGFSHTPAPPPALQIRVSVAASPEVAPIVLPRTPAVLTGEVALAATTAAATGADAPPAHQSAVETAAAAVVQPREAKSMPMPVTPGGGPADSLAMEPGGGDLTLAQGNTLLLTESFKRALQPQGPSQASVEALHPAPQQSAPTVDNATLRAEQEPLTPRPPAEQVALQLRSAFRKGVDRINIQLKPAALGAIDIVLDVAHDGRVSAIITADRSETLELLQRDARGIERVLHDAGLRTDSGSLSFSLRGDGRQTPAQGDAPTGSEPGQSAATADEANEAAPRPAHASNHAVNIEV